MYIRLLARKVGGRKRVGDAVVFEELGGGMKLLWANKTETETREIPERPERGRGLFTCRGPRGPIGC